MREYESNAIDQITRFTGPTQQEKRWSYDGLARMTPRTLTQRCTTIITAQCVGEPAQLQMTWTGHDAAWNPAELIEQMRQRSTYIYDELGRRTAMGIPTRVNRPLPRLVLVHTGANRPDHECAEALLSQLKGIRRHQKGRIKRKLGALCADLAYVVSPCDKAISWGKMEDKIILKDSESSKGLGKIRDKSERTFSWYDGYRKIRLRDARQLLTWDALHHVAFICITFKQIMNVC